MKNESRVILRRASCAAAPFGVLAFWVGMVMAARRYPSEYERRDMPVSRLLSPVRGPGDGSGTVVHFVLSALMIKERL